MNLMCAVMAEITLVTLISAYKLFGRAAAVTGY